MLYRTRSHDPEIIEFTDSRRRPCLSCSRPPCVADYTPSAGKPAAFNCPHSRYASHAGLSTFPDVEQMQEITELWT